MGKEFRSPRRPFENNRCRAAVHSQVVQTPIFDFEFAPIRIAQIERLKPIVAVIKATESHGANMLAGGRQGQVRSSRSLDKPISPITPGAFETQQASRLQPPDVAPGCLGADLPVSHDIPGLGAISLADSVEKPALTFIQALHHWAIYGVMIRVIYRVISDGMLTHRVCCNRLGC